MVLIDQLIELNLFSLDSSFKFQINISHEVIAQINIMYTYILDLKFKIKKNCISKTSSVGLQILYNLNARS